MKLSVFTKCVLVTLLLLVLTLCAVSCNRNDENPDDTTVTDQEETTAPTEEVTEIPPVDIDLVKDKQFAYTVVVPDNSMIEAVAFLRSTVIKLTKARCDAITMDQIDKATTKNFIYVGFYPGEIEGTTADENMTFGSWIMEVVNGKDIAISGYSASGMYGGVDVLSKKLEAAYSNGNATVQISRTTGAYYTGLFAHLPVPQGYDREFPQKQFESGVGVTQLRFDDFSAGDALRYMELMKTCGLTEHSSFNVGDTYGGTYYAENEVVYYVVHHTGALRINTMPYSEAFLPENPNEPNFTKVCNTKGYMASVRDINGMCFIYLLADGTFLIFDGGRDSIDAAHLYSLLERLADQNGLDEIVIAAIQISHAHGDHFGFFQDFLNRYVQTNKVKLEAVWLNRSTADHGRGEKYKEMVSGESKIQEYVELFAKGTKIIPLHTGQSFYMADAYIEVMHTMEDFDQYACYAEGDTNAASTSVRITVNDKRILMTGDAFRTNTLMMAEMYKEDLQCDFLQVPHHGVWYEDNGTKPFYKMVNPTYALIPCGDALWATASKQIATDYLLNVVMANRNKLNETVFYARTYDGPNAERVVEINFSTGKASIIIEKK